MKNMLKTAAITISSALLLSGAVITAGASNVEKDCIKDNCYLVKYTVNGRDVCSELNLNDIKSLLEKYGCGSNYIQDVVTSITSGGEGEKDVVVDSENNIEIVVPDKAPSENTEDAGNTNDTENGVVSEYEKRVADLVNEIRVSRGLAPLSLNTELSAVARAKSQDMKTSGYFDHTSPVYGSPFDMMKSFGISYRTAGENIAMGQRTPEEVVDAWMNSDGHRANILNSSFTQIGVGYIADGNYWTQMFIG